jgi:ATP-dependent Clp protease ATP-binding subunit ClpX
MSFPSKNEILRLLKESVVGQEEAIERLVVAVDNHFFEIAKGVEPRTKLNIFITGPTGSGKTFLLETLADILHVAFKQINAGRIVPAGYDGFHIADAFKELIKECDNNLERAEHSILVWDEIDKRKYRNSSHEDIGQMVQEELLKSLGADRIAGIDTKNILQVGTGAFVGLSDIVRSRLNNPRLSENEAQNAALPEDFQTFGMIPELMGRFPIRLHVEKLSLDDYRRIIDSKKNSFIAQKRSLFEDHGFELHLTEAALEAMAKKAFKHDLGLRALQTVISDACDKIQLRFDDLYKQGKRRIEITEEVITKSESPRASFSTKFTSKNADQIRARMNELFERIKKDKDTTNSKPSDKKEPTPKPEENSAPSGSSTASSSEKPHTSEAYSFIPGAGSIFTEAEKRELKELLKSKRKNERTGGAFEGIRRRLQEMLNFSGGFGVNPSSTRVLTSLFSGIVTYTIIASLGDERRGFQIGHTVRYLLCRSEFSVWHLAGIVFALPAAFWMRYRNFAQTATATAVGVFALVIYAALIAFGARGEIFSFKHAIFSWLTFFDHALWRRGNVSLWNFFAAATSGLIFIWALRLSESPKAWDYGARVFRVLTGRGPTEATDLESTPYS